MTTNQSKTNDELTNHIIKSIDQWIDKYRNDFNLPANISLVNTVDYSVEFKDDRAGQQLVIITCVCGLKSTLNRHGSNGYLQVSGQSFHL